MVSESRGTTRIGVACRMATAGLLGLCLAACQRPGAATQPVLTDGLPLPVTRETVAESLALPAEVRSEFFLTLHALGNRVTGTGVLVYRSPTDFRMTAITETGMILFDAQATADGVRVLRGTPGLDTGTLQAIARDLALAFSRPTNLQALVLAPEAGTLRAVQGDLPFTYRFAPHPRLVLRSAEVQLGMLDKLTIEYVDRRPGAKFPTELTLRRPLRGYTLFVTFTSKP